VELLDSLQELYKRTGGLSVRLIHEREDMPCLSLYQTRFGGLMEAYRRIGYNCPSVAATTQIAKQVGLRRREYSKLLVDELRATGACVELGPRPGLLTVNQEFTILFTVARCVVNDRRTKWKLRLNSRMRPDITVIGRMAPGNEVILDYYLVGGTEKLETTLTVEPENGFAIDVYRFNDLSVLKNLARRTGIKEQA
jgi:hypothetical protein